MVAAGAVALGACSGTPSVDASANGVAPTTRAPSTAPDDSSLDTSLDTVPDSLTTSTTPGGPGANSGAGSGNPSGGNANPSAGNAGGGGGGGGGNSGGNTGGGGAPPSTAPTVTSATGPGTINCPDMTSTVTFTAHYSVTNAKFVEYLQPGSARPGAGNATGSVMLNYDCSMPSATYKIRAFNEFNGSDSKDPSPYVAFTVNRKLTGSSSTTSTTHP
jgi:hypothetical protein